MTDQKYNGWANYETWRVNLELFDGYDPDGSPVDGDMLADMADDYLTADGAGGLALDYARAFLSAVNWYEIARAINENNELDPET